jgi:hypothetical protein
MLSEQTIRGSGHSVGDHADQLGMLEGVASHRELPDASCSWQVGCEQPPKIRKARIARQLKQTPVEVRVGQGVVESSSGASRSHGGLSQLRDAPELRVRQSPIGQSAQRSKLDE